MTSLTSITEVRALVRSRLSDSDLQAVIDREEAWLAGRVGALTGARTDTFTPGFGDTPLYLRRRAESVVAHRRSPHARRGRVPVHAHDRDDPAHLDA